MSSRTEYHRNYYHQNIERRREQRRASKRGLSASIEPAPARTLRASQTDVQSILNAWPRPHQ